MDNTILWRNYVCPSHLAEKNQTLLKVEWKFVKGVDTNGSNSHGETLSGCKIDDGSSH